MPADDYQAELLKNMLDLAELEDLIEQREGVLEQ
jgi:hypothetical protein